MAATQKLKSGVTCVWGANGVSYTAKGIVERATVATDGQLRLMPDVDGETAAVVFFDNTDTLDLQIYCSSGATKPARGEPITAGGITGYVLNSAITWQAGDFQRMTIRANKWVNIS